MTRRRRGKRGRTSPDPPTTKRRRGGPPEVESNNYPEPVPTPAPAASQPSSVMVAGLPPGCGVLELKSRLEAYGPIARARVDVSAATGYVTFRSGAAAVAAIAASLDPGGGVAIGSKKVLVLQASEAPHNFFHDRVCARFSAPHNSRSTIRAAEPAGRSSHDATVKNVSDNSAILSSKAASGVTYKAREIVAYDDLF